MARDEYWNHNVHYQPVILRAVPPRCGPALDVGCGDGMLACRLAERCTEVTGIDRDDRMIALARERARTQARSGHLNFVAADFLAYPLAEASFDFATASRLLPGVRYRRRLLWRYSLLWRKPGG
jgi:ubiquinone/menaquinone biosynthesis C-methylase UbiE